MGSEEPICNVLAWLKVKCLIRRANGLNYPRDLDFTTFPFFLLSPLMDPHGGGEKV